MKNSLDTRSVWINPIHFLAFGLGSGTAPFAPGTMGTLMAIPLYLLLRDFSLGTYALILLGATLLGVWLCDVTGRDLGVHDYKGIVWDEFCGYWLTMLAAPRHWLWIVVGFFLFRLFDIWKPWPIRVIDAKVPGGLGVMLDDIVAGLFSWAAMQCLIKLVSHG